MNHTPHGADDLAAPTPNQSNHAHAAQSVQPCAVHPNAVHPCAARPVPASVLRQREAALETAFARALRDAHEAPLVTTTVRTASSAAACS